MSQIQYLESRLEEVIPVLREIFALTLSIIDSYLIYTGALLVRGHQNYAMIATGIAVSGMIYCLHKSLATRLGDPHPSQSLGLLLMCSVPFVCVAIYLSALGAFSFIKPDMDKINTRQAIRAFWNEEGQKLSAFLVKVESALTQS